MSDETNLPSEDAKQAYAAAGFEQGRHEVSDDSAQRQAAHRMAAMTAAGDRLLEELRRTYSRPLRPLARLLKRAGLRLVLGFEGILISKARAKKLRQELSGRVPRNLQALWLEARGLAALPAPAPPGQADLAKTSPAEWLHFRALRLAAKLLRPISPQQAEGLRRSADRRYPRQRRGAMGIAFRRGNVWPITDDLVTEQKRALARFATHGAVRLPTSDSPLVSVIIPTYGQIDYTIRCLMSLAINAPRASFEVIVMDDAYPDAAAVRLHAGIEGVRIVRNEQNKGFLLTCNAAARLAKGAYLLFLNNDTEIMPGAIDALLAPFEADERIGMTGAKLIYPDGTLQEAGGIIWADGTGWNYGRGSDPDRPEFNYRREVDYISGAAIMVPNALFDELGGFDPAFAPAYCEDSDLAFRLRARGLKVVYEPRSVVIHVEGISHGKDVGTGTKAYQIANTERLRTRWRDVLAREHCSGPEQLLRARDRGRHRPSILVIDHYVPEPDRDAGSRTMLSFLIALREAGWVVKFWPQNRSYSANYTPPLQDLGIEVLDMRWPGGLGEWLKINGAEIDHVLVSRPMVATDVLMQLVTMTWARLSYYGHDLHFLRMKRQAELLDDAMVELEAARMERLERRLWRQFDTVIYPSQAEADFVAASTPGVLARAVTPYHYDRFEERSQAPSGHQILFVAGFAHEPNVDAAQFLVREVMPRVWSEVPDARLALVGSHPTAAVRTLASDAVEVSGWVSDERLRQYYLEARVAAAPLRFGGGVKSKVTEAMAMGLPLVTTSMGAEGIVGLDKVMPIHDDPQAIATEIVALLKEDDRWMHISRSQIAYAQQHFSRAALKQSLIDALSPQN